MRHRITDGLAAVLWLIMALTFLSRGAEVPRCGGAGGHAPLPVLSGAEGLTCSLAPLLNWGLALVNGLLAFLFVARRQARRTTGLGPFLVALGVTVGSLLLRPASTGLQIPGLLLELLSLPWIVASLLSLGPAVGMAPADRGLRTGGTYRIVRHPLYAGELLCSLGYVVGNGSLGNGLLWLLLLSGVLLRIRWEERLLGEQYPDGYAAYRRQVVWRLLPFLI